MLRSLVLCALLALSGSAALAQEPPQWNFNNTIDGANGTYGLVATFLVEVGKTHQLCVGNPHVDANGNEITTFDLVVRRYRVEGGLPETADRVPLSSLTPGTGERMYCLQSDPIPRAGHWVYEAAWCYENGGACSLFSTGLEPGDEDFTTPAAGYVDPLGPKGWWIYAYLGKPVIVVD